MRGSLGVEESLRMRMSKAGGMRGQGRVVWRREERKKESENEPRIKREEGERVESQITVPL